MPFKFLKDLANAFSLRVARGSSGSEGKILMLFDTEISGKNENLLENFLKISNEVYLVSPVGDLKDEEIRESLGEISSICGEGFFLIVTGRFSPFIIESYHNFRSASKVIFINPTFRNDIATKMSSFVSPSLVVTATPGNLDHDPDAVKYHDLISGSQIQYVRGVSGNPLFHKFTQSFNSIQRFLLDD